MEFWETDTIQTKKCGTCGDVKPLESYVKNKRGKCGRHSICKACRKNQKKQWDENDKPRRNANRRTKRDTDPLFVVEDRARSRITQAFKRKNWSKDSLTREMLGCDWETLKIHMELQFTNGMSWDNKCKWQIDHIVPLSIAITDSELEKLCHYTNLQPLWTHDNRVKGNKLLKEHYDLHYTLLGRHYKE